MSKHKLRNKPLALARAPLLLTDVHVAGWRDGVLFLDAESGPTKGTLALGPNAVCYLIQALQASMRDNASPFHRPRADRVVEASQDIEGAKQ